MDDVQYKAVAGGVKVLDMDKGEVECVFATLGVKDKDGDVTVPGAFKEGQVVAISQHGHTIWDGSAPVGKGQIFTEGHEAVFKGQFFMDMAAARDTFHAVKGMAEHGQWSYGFQTTKSQPGDFQGEKVKFLLEQDVFEVSPVLRGAGVGTRTTSAKQARQNSTAPTERGSAVAALYRAIPTHETAATTKRWNPPASLADLSIDQLRAKHAAVDVTMEPTDPAAYLFDHHDETGAANIRRCLLGIARLNGAKGAPSLPADVRQSVYDHLADHLRDGDRDAPELHDGTPDKLKFYDHLLITLADVQATRERSAEVVALRSKRREMSRRDTKASERSPASVLAPISVDLLEWITDELRQLKSLVDTPQEDLAREQIRFMREQFILDNPDLIEHD